MNASQGFLNRRTFLVGAGAAATVGLGGTLLLDGPPNASVFIARAERYDDTLANIIRRGLAELGVSRAWAQGKSIMLKPNLVEPALELPHINTHPAMVRAVIEVFRQLDAREVFVAEGQGNVRDSFLVLEQSGLGPVLEEANCPFVDLNHDDFYLANNPWRYTELPQLYMPQSLRRADLVVSLPKLKTHKWAGVTLSMKNLFGVMPGVCYGWPKNIFHQRGIHQSTLDITATVRPHLAIIDGIIGMERLGPTDGSPRQANVVVMGTNLVAVDATGARIMGFDPEGVDHIRVAAARKMGPVASKQIEQRGEPLAAVQQHFLLHDHPHFDQFRRLGS